MKLQPYIYNLVSLGGMVVLLGTAWLLSSSKKNINWRALVWGFALQMAFGAFIFLFPPGRQLFIFLNDIVVAILNSSLAGVRFVFGWLAAPNEVLGPLFGNMVKSGQMKAVPNLFILATQSFPTIIFFSALMALLYYLKIMPLIIKGFSFVFAKLMRISGAESVATASNIFVGVESALTVKPYLEEMTKSELALVLTAGMATIASSVLGIYVMALKGTFPSIAGHLISASILSAPAAIMMAKLMVPEDDAPKTMGKDVEPHYERDANVFASVINGANDGLKLVFGIVALLIAVLGIVALVNLTLGFGVGIFNKICHTTFTLVLDDIFGLVFYPFTLAIGVPVEDAFKIARVIGERVVSTEVKSYSDLAALMASGSLKYQRSAVIASYALCGFAHIPSLAIFVGGISALAPGRMKDLTSIAARALVAATLACLFTACIAGFFFTTTPIVLHFK
ncbi:MAG: nucleoside transporter C-terminal domain-containing protein [Spirochaetota bacterium]